jgi:hypothetical protein
MMKTLRKTGQNWLKVFHIIFVAAWLGAALSANLLKLLNRQMPNGEALAALHLLVKKMDMLIIPSAIGVVVTSVLISLLTNWGFTIFRWITVLWIVLITQIVYGIVVLGPLTDSLLEMATSEGLLPLKTKFTSGITHYFQFSECFRF